MGNILKQSMVMEGRFHVLKSAADINSANFAEVEKDLFDQIVVPKKYPCVVMLPPTEVEPNNDKGWSTYHCRLFFLTLYRRTGDGDIKDVDIQTNSSQHTKEMDWADMRACAGSFRKVFRQLTRVPPLTNSIHEHAHDNGTYERFSAKGNDNVNGIVAGFSVQLFQDTCNTLADYPEAGAIQIPAVNPHPLHKQ